MLNLSPSTLDIEARGTRSEAAGKAVTTARRGRNENNLMVRMNVSLDGAKEVQGSNMFIYPLE
jgi:hypothetical protein